MGKVFNDVFQKKSSEEQKGKERTKHQGKEIANWSMNLEEQGGKYSDTCFEIHCFRILRGKSMTLKGIS